MNWSLRRLLKTWRHSADGHLASCSACFAMRLFVVFVVLTIAGMWKLFEQAGSSVWPAAIFQPYNMFVMNEVATGKILWFVLTLIPCR